MNRTEARKKAEALVAKMTVEEAASQLRYDAPGIERLGVPAWVDLWGEDVNHDWPWWLIQFPYFVKHILGE